MSASKDEPAMTPAEAEAELEVSVASSVLAEYFMHIKKTPRESLRVMLKLIAFIHAAYGWDLDETIAELRKELGKAHVAIADNAGRQ